MNLVEQYATTLSDETKRSVIREHDQLKSEGFIGQGVLREKARELMEVLGLRDSRDITTWMRELAHECIRYYANLYLQEHQA